MAVVDVQVGRLGAEGRSGDVEKDDPLVAKSGAIPAAPPDVIRPEAADNSPNSTKLLPVSTREQALGVNLSLPRPMPAAFPRQHPHRPLHNPRSRWRRHHIH